MRELYKTLLIGVLLLGLNMIVFRMLPALNVGTGGSEQYVLFLDMLYVLYIFLPHRVGTFFEDLGNNNNNIEFIGKKNNNSYCFIYFVNNTSFLSKSYKSKSKNNINNVEEEIIKLYNLNNEILNIILNVYLISIGLISQVKLFSKLFFPVKFPVITDVKLDLEDDTNVKYLSSINPFPLGSKPLQPAPGIYNSAQACKSNSEGNGSSK